MTIIQIRSSYKNLKIQISVSAEVGNEFILLSKYMINAQLSKEFILNVSAYETQISAIIYTHRSGMVNGRLYCESF
jgi:hypothetical protein